MSIPEVELLMYMRGMEIHTEHYENIYNKHMDLLGYEQTLQGEPVKYWRNNDKKRKRHAREDLTEEVRAIVSDTYSDIRQSMRFGLTRDYTRKFVIDNINSFEDLLQFGRYMLTYIHQNKHKYIDTCTGVEPSIYLDGDWPILQMIQLNQYMYTHTSTNFPCQLFQPMFVWGYIPKSKVAAIKAKLDKTKYKYEIGKTFFYGLHPVGLDEKPWTRNMTELRVEDPELTNRNLYSKLLAIFQSI